MPVGEDGELILSGPNIMQGYWRRPESLKGNHFVEIDGKRWLRTGDLVRMDEEGYFYFFDRKRDLIKYKGYSVFARHVEEVLYGHPQVKAAGVVGVPDPKVGQHDQSLCCAPERGPGQDFRRGNHGILQGEHGPLQGAPSIIEFRGELPKTDVGKVSRRELREEAEGSLI
jgi:long-chain acyl-CoA synthetase